MNTLRNRFSFNAAILRAAASEGNGPSISFVIPSEVQGWKAGDTLTEPVDVAAYWKAAYAEASENGETLDDMSDDEVLSLAASVEPAMNDDGSFSDADEYMLEVFEAFEEGGEQAPLADDLMGVMSKIAGDKEASDWINRVIEAHKDVDSGAVHIAERFLATLDRQEIAVMPWPGSKANIGNRPNDITEKRVPKRNGNGEKTTSESKVKGMIAAHPIIQDLELKVKAQEESLPQGAKLSESPMQRDAIKELNKQIANASRAIRQAIALTILKDHFDDHQLIEVDFKRDTEGKAKRETYCIHVDNRVNKREQTTVTVLAVTRIDFGKVKPTTGWQSFLDMMQRKRKPKVPTSKYEMPKGVSEACELFSVVNHTLAHAGLYSAIQVQTGITQGENKEASDDLLWNLRSIEQYVNSLLDRPGMRARAKAIAEARDKAAA